MNKKKRIVYLYDNLQKPGEKEVSVDQIAIEASKISGVPIEGVKEIFNIFSDILKTKVEEKGEFVLGEIDDVEYVVKKPDFN